MWVLLCKLDDLFLHRRVTCSGRCFGVLCRTHMQDMQEVTQEVHYENFRHQKLASSAAGDSAVTSSSRQVVFVARNNSFVCVDL